MLHAAPGLPKRLETKGNSPICVFVFIQTIRHRDYFLTDGETGDESAHAAPPSARTTLGSCVALVACLVAVVLLAKLLSPAVELAVLGAGAPGAVGGIVVAALLLLPEGLI